MGKEGEVEVDIVEPLRRTQARAQGRCVACRRACGEVWVASEEAEMWERIWKKKRR